MTEMDFLIDEQVLAEDLKVNPPTADPAALEETYFIMPVRMRIGETELFSSNAAASPWLPLPVLGFATHLLAALGKCLSNMDGTMFLAGGGHLKFEVAGENVTITCTLTRQRASVSRREIWDEANKFAQKVRDFLLNRVPEIKQHRSWNQWFPSKSRGK